MKVTHEHQRPGAARPKRAPLSRSRVLVALGVGAALSLTGLGLSPVAANEHDAIVQADTPEESADLLCPGVALPAPGEEPGTVYEVTSDFDFEWWSGEPPQGRYAPLGGPRSEQ